jgi:hypothetical protein
MSMYIRTIIRKWFNDEKNLQILNGIVRHWSDRQIAREGHIRIDAVANHRSALKRKGLLTAGFFSINHEKLGLVQLMDFPRERPSVDDTFLTFLVRISRPFGYLRLRLLPPEMVEEGHQLGAGVHVMNDFTIPFVREDFRDELEKVIDQAELELYEKKNKKKNGKIDLLSVYICKEVQKGFYGARVLAREISHQIDEEKMGIQPSISNVNRRLRQMKADGIICKSNPLNLVPLRPYYNLDSAIVKKNNNFNRILAALARLNVMVQFYDVLNEGNRAYLVLQYHYGQKWDILGILSDYLEEITFFDHSPFEIRRTIPFEYFEELLSQKKWI